MAAGLALEVRGLSKAYGAVRAFQQISFEVREGECFGLIGPEGAGKSSLMRTLYGVTPLEVGDVFACGLNMKTSRYQLKSLMGVVPESGGLDPDFTVLDNLVLFGQCFKLSAQEAKGRSLALLRRLNIEPVAHQMVRELSLGVARRALLARALVPHPQILLLDEPTIGLDSSVRYLTWDFLKELSIEKKLTLVLATHNLKEAQRLCDRVAIMDAGAILALGTPRELIQSNVGDEVVELTCKEHEVRYFHSQLGGRFDLQVFKTGLRVYNADARSLRDDFAKLHVDSLIIRKGTLEDVYFKLSSQDSSYSESEVASL